MEADVTPILTILPRRDDRRKHSAEEIEDFYQTHGARWRNPFAKRETGGKSEGAQPMHIRCTSHAYAKCES